MWTKRGSNETEERDLEVEAAFPNVVFGVAPAILKEKLHDQLEKFIRSTSPERLGDHVRPIVYNEKNM